MPGAAKVASLVSWTTKTDFHRCNPPGPGFTDDGFTDSLRLEASELKAGFLLQVALSHGDIRTVPNTPEYTTRCSPINPTAAEGLSSTLSRAPFWLAFPFDNRERLFPNLLDDGALPVWLTIEASSLCPNPRAQPLTVLDGSSQL